MRSGVEGGEADGGAGSMKGGREGGGRNDRRQPFLHSLDSFINRSHDRNLGNGRYRKYTKRERERGREREREQQTHYA